MKIERTKHVLTCALAWTVLAGPVAARTPRPTITLRVINEARVPSSTLLEARTEAAMILGLSDIDLIWLTCDAVPGNWARGNPCSTQLKPNEFWLYVTNQRPPRAPLDLLGFTDFQRGPERGEAGVYYPAALRLAEPPKADLFQILAAAIAHEVGHLILGAKSHSAYGVMSPGFGDQQLRMISHRWLRFTPEQSRLLQNEVRRRSEWDYASR